MAPHTDTAAFWERLPGAPGEATFHQDYLAAQCTLIGGVALGAVVRLDGTGAGELLAVWPRVDSDPGPLQPMLGQLVAEPVGTVLPLTPVPATGNANFLLGYPLLVEEHLWGAVVVALAAAEESRLQLAMGHLEWGGHVLTAARLDARVAELLQRDRQLRWSVELLAGVLSREAFPDAASQLVTALAARLNCDRVSLGVWQRGRVRVTTLSHTLQFGHKVGLLRAIEAAMAEALEQAAELRHPMPKAAFPMADGPGGEGGRDAPITRAQRDLAQSLGHAAVMTLPLFDHHGGDHLGAITLERPGEQPFTDDERDSCVSIAALAGAALRDKWHNHRPLPVKAALAAKVQLQRLVGPGHTTRKLAALGVVMVTAFALLAQGEYHLAADATLESRHQHIVTAPDDGFIDTAPAREGDTVTAGAVLATLDTRDLRLERLKWLSQRAQELIQLKEAQARGEGAQLAISRAKVAQAEAELALAEGRLQRAAMTAPFDALILRGDLSQRLGDAVTQGEELFVAATLNDYRVKLRIPERRVLDLQPGQRGRLILKSIPGERFPFTVTRLIPLAQAADGETFYLAEATLEEESPRLRPGMEGVAKVLVDRRRLVAIWSRDLLEWLQMVLWRWWS